MYFYYKISMKIKLFLFSFLSDLCRGVNCKHGAHCEQGLCVCPTNCPQSEETLCATDMTTVSAYYKNIVVAIAEEDTPQQYGFYCHLKTLLDGTALMMFT